MNTRSGLRIAAAVAAVTLAGCAHLPDAQVKYYPASVESQLQGDSHW